MTNRACLAIALLVSGALKLHGQAWVDINPNSSALHPTDPDASAGGRIQSIATAADRSAFYATSEWGGLFKSVNGGQTWNHLENHVAMMTWRVAVDPSNAQRVYTTSLYDGRQPAQSLGGVNFSPDGGLTWKHSSVPVNPVCPTKAQNNPAGYGLSIDPDNPAHVFAGTNCGVVATLDAGASWNYVFPATTADAGIVWSVLVHDAGIIDICGEQGHLRSIDAGVTWTTASSPLPLPSGRCDLAASPFDANTIFAIVGETRFESKDGGASWPTVNDSPDIGSGAGIPSLTANRRGGKKFDLWTGHWDLYARSCNSASASPCLQGGSDGLGLGYDHGAHDDSGELLFDPSMSVDACPLLFATDGGIEINTRAGTAACQDVAWVQPKTSPHALWVRGLSGSRLMFFIPIIPWWLWPGLPPIPIFLPPQFNLFVGAQDNGFWKGYPFGGPAWTHVEGADASDVIADPIRVVHEWCCDPGIDVHPTTLWTAPTVPDLPAFPMNGDVELARYGPKKYALLSTEGLFATTNMTVSPTSWTLLGTSVLPIDPLYTMGRLSVSNPPIGAPSFYVLLTDLAASFTPLKEGHVWRFVGTAPGVPQTQLQPPPYSGMLPGAPTGGFGIFAVDPGKPKRIMASQMTTGYTPRMIRSNDGGASWATMPALDQCMTYNGRFRYENDGGLAGATSARPGHYSMEGYAQPLLAAFDSLDSNIIVAGAVDAGVFVTFNDGRSWIRLTDPLGVKAGVPHLPRPRFAFITRSGVTPVLFIGTQGRGVWMLPLDASVRGLRPAC